MTVWLNIYDTFTERWLGRIRLPTKPEWMSDGPGEYPVERGAYQELGIVRDEEGSLDFTIERYEEKEHGENHRRQAGTEG